MAGIGAMMRNRASPSCRSSARSARFVATRRNARDANDAGTPACSSRTAGVIPAAAVASSWSGSDSAAITASGSASTCLTAIVSASSCAAGLEALAPSARARSRQAAADVRVERSRLRSALMESQCVRQVLRSEANFLLVRFHDAQLAWERLIDAGIVVRDMRADPRLQDALRITVGSPEQNARLLEALR